MAVKRFKPVAVVQQDPGVVFVGAPTLPLAVDDPPGPPSDPDEIATYAQGDGGVQADFLCLSEPMEAAQGFASVKVLVRARNEGTPGGGEGWQAIARRLDDTLFTSALQTNTAFADVEITVTAPGGGWTNEEVDGLRFGMRHVGGVANSCTQAYKTVDYTPAPQAVEQQRIVASQILRRRLEQLLVKMSLPLKFMDMDVLELFAMSHPLFPTENGIGVGEERWERLLLLLLGGHVDPMTDTMDINALDVKKYLSSYLDSGQLTIGTSEGIIAPSIARLSMGGTRQFTRASRAFALDPSGLIWKEFQVDSEAISREGILLEKATTNRIRNPAFIDGFTNGWSTFNNGVGGAAVTLDTLKFVFEQSALVTTAQSVKIVTTATLAGADHTTAFAGFAHSDNLTLSFIHDHDSGLSGSFDVQIRNNTTNNWLTSGGGWSGTQQVAATFTSSLTPIRSFLRFTLESSGFGGGASLFIRIRNVTASTTAHLYHGQIETSVSTSPVVSSGAVDGTRSQAILNLSNDFGKRVLDVQHGFFAFEAVPGFNHGDVTASHAMFSCEIDANNFIRCFYDNGTRPWVFVIRSGGTSYRAEGEGNAVRGVPQKIVCRWTNDEGQHGLTNVNSIFVDGVKGSVEATHVKHVQPLTQTLNLGTLSGLSANCEIRRIRAGKHVPSDLEVKGLFL